MLFLISMVLLITPASRAPSTTKWIKAMLDNPGICAALGSEATTVSVSRGCPQERDLITSALVSYP